MNNNPNFNKSFEALYNTAMTMADNCIVNNSIENRFDKLHEEFKEVFEAYAQYKEGQHHIKRGEQEVVQLLNELSDLHFVLLHTARRIDPTCTGFELLHRAASKMLNRMNDQEYKAKN